MVSAWPRLWAEFYLFFVWFDVPAPVYLFLAYGAFPVVVQQLGDSHSESVYSFLLEFIPLNFPKNNKT